MTHRPFLILITLVLALSSCSVPKNVAYFQNLQTTGTQVSPQAASTFEAKIKPKDLLTITVVASNQEATKNYNLIVPQISTNITTTSYTQPAIQPYLVEKDGTIDFPTLGTLQVAGLTRSELKKVILDKIRPAFNEEIPIITINILNFSINVLGEVARPGRLTVTNERFTILDAIAQAGDLTLYGKRDNIKVLREHADGSKEYLTVNLNDQNIIYSSAYYLEQNDIVYVEPNNVRKRTSNIGAAETLSISVISTLISITSLLVNILRK